MEDASFSGVELIVVSDTLLSSGQVCTKQGKCAFVIRAWKVKSQVYLCCRRVSISLFFLLLFCDMFEKHDSKPPQKTIAIKETTTTWCTGGLSTNVYKMCSFISTIPSVCLCMWTYTNTNALISQTVFSAFRGRDLQTAEWQENNEVLLSSNEEVLPGSRVTLDGSWEGRNGRRRWANLWFHQKNVHVKCVGGWGRIWNPTSVIPHAPVLHVWLWGFCF